MTTRNHNLGRMTCTATSSLFSLIAAAPNCRTFAQCGVVNGDKVGYRIQNAGQKEEGYGIYSSTGPTLTRNVIRSTNADTPIALPLDDVIYPFIQLVLLPAFTDIEGTVANAQLDPDLA